MGLAIVSAGLQNHHYVERSLPGCPVASPVRPQFKQPDLKYMTFVEHLEELRHRLIKSMGAIALGSIVGWFLAKHVIQLLVAPVRTYLHVKTLYVPQVYGAFTINLKIAIIIGFAFALPVTMYQVWAFISPAFGGKASRVGPLVITSALLLFAAAVVRTAWVPRPIAYLMGLSGLTYLVQGWVVGSEGFSRTVTIAIVLAFVLDLAWMIWLIVVAWRMQDSEAPSPRR